MATFACLHIRQYDSLRGLELTVCGRYRVAVWIVNGISEKFFKPKYQLFALNMLQLFGHFVNLVPCEVQLVVQKHFPKTVFSDDLNSHMPAGPGQLHFSVLFVSYQLLVRKLAQHVRYCGWLGMDFFRDLVSRRV